MCFVHFLNLSVYYEYNKLVLNLFNSPQLDFLECTKNMTMPLYSYRKPRFVSLGIFIRSHKQRDYLARGTFSAEMLSRRGVRDVTPDDAPHALTSITQLSARCVAVVYMTRSRLQLR